MGPLPEDEEHRVKLQRDVEEASTIAGVAFRFAYCQLVEESMSEAFLLADERGLALSKATDAEAAVTDDANGVIVQGLMDAFHAAGKRALSPNDQETKAQFVGEDHAVETKMPALVQSAPLMRFVTTAAERQLCTDIFQAYFDVSAVSLRPGLGHSAAPHALILSRCCFPAMQAAAYEQEDIHIVERLLLRLKNAASFAIATLQKPEITILMAAVTWNWRWELEEPSSAEDTIWAYKLFRYVRLVFDVRLGS